MPKPLLIKEFFDVVHMLLIEIVQVFALKNETILQQQKKRITDNYF